MRRRIIQGEENRGTLMGRTTVNILHIVLLLCCILTFVEKGEAQQIRHLNVEQGLSSRQASSTVQDKYQFIWISTKIGIDRFDGHEVKHYRLPLGEFEFPSENYFLRTDPDLNVWAYSDIGQLFKYDYAQDRFVLHYNFYDNQFTSSLRVTDVYFMQDNSIWICTQTGLFFMKDGELHRMKGSPLSQELIVSVQEISKNQVLIATSTQLYTLNTLDLCFERLPINLGEGKSILSFLYDKSSNCVWLGTFDSGVYQYRLSDATLHSLNQRIHRLPTSPIRSFALLPDNELYIGYDGSGVWVYESNKAAIKQVYRDDETYKYTLDGNGVYDIFVDTKQRIWVSTYTGGVNIIDINALDFHSIDENFDFNKTIEQKSINAIVEGRKNEFWFATDNGVAKYNRTNQSIDYFLRSSEGPANIFLTLCKDSEGHIWAGSYGKGAYVLDNNGTVLHRFSNKKKESNKIGTNHVYSLYCDKGNNIWIGGRHGKLSQYNYSQKCFYQYRTPSINGFAEQSEFQLYVATTIGIYLLDEVYATMKLISPRFYVYCITQSVNKDIYYGTKGNGMCHYLPDSDSTIVYTTKHGLPSNHIYSIEEQGNFLWVSTENGIAKFDKNTKSFETYSVEDGLIDKTFLQGSSCTTSDNQILFGSYQGLTSFQPEQISRIETESTLFLAAFKLFNKIVFPDSIKGPIKNPIQEVSNIHLDHSEHSFSIVFHSLNLFCSDKIRYTWRLVGLEDTWNTPSSLTTINYTNLQAGDYCLVIRALDYSSNKILDEKELHITVDTSWWNSLDAYFLYLIIVQIVTFLCFKYWQMRVKRKSSEDKINFFTNTAHDLKTPLSLVAAPLQELDNDSLSEKGKYYLSLSLTNLDKLTNVVSQLLDFQKLDTNSEKLLLQQVDINKTTQQFVSAYETFAHRKDISIEYYVQGQNKEEWIDTAKYETIVDNLLSNAIKYTPQKGEIVVRLIEKRRHWLLQVSDSGIGISKEAQANLFQQFYRGENAINSSIPGSGIGLLLVRNLVHLHKGQIFVHSELNQGSTFTIEFKKGKSHFPTDSTFTSSTTTIARRISKPQGVLSNVPQNNDVVQKEKSSDLPHLIIADDNEELRNFLSFILDDFFQIRLADDGAKALELIEKEAPDIIISDVNMPRLSGIQLAKKVREQFETSHIPIVLLSAMSETSEVTQELREGIDDYITKPFDVHSLQKKMQELVHKRHLERSHVAQGNTDFHCMELDPKDATFLAQFSIILDSSKGNSLSTPDSIAQEMNISEELLHRKIRSLTSLTFEEYRLQL